MPEKTTRSLRAQAIAAASIDLTGDTLRRVRHRSLGALVMMLVYTFAFSSNLAFTAALAGGLVSLGNFALIEKAVTKMLLSAGKQARRAAMLYVGKSMLLVAGVIAAVVVARLPALWFINGLSCVVFGILAEAMLLLGGLLAGPNNRTEEV